MGSVTSCDSGGRGETLYESSRLLHNSTSFLARLPALPILPPLCTLPPLSLPPSSYTYSHPINILPVTLVEQKRGGGGGGGGGGSRSSSLVTLEGRQRGGVEEGRRRGSEMSTAQLLTNASCKTAFASQYVATYLSELVTNGEAQFGRSAEHVILNTHAHTHMHTHTCILATITDTHTTPHTHRCSCRQ